MYGALGERKTMPFSKVSLKPINLRDTRSNHFIPKPVSSGLAWTALGGKTLVVEARGRVPASNEAWLILGWGTGDGFLGYRWINLSVCFFLKMRHMAMFDDIQRKRFVMELFSFGDLMLRLIVTKAYEFI